MGSSHVEKETLPNISTLVTVSLPTSLHSVFHFNDWLAEKAELHERMRANIPIHRNQENQVNAGLLK